MKRKPKAPKLIKTSISLPEVLWDFASRRCEEEGFSSFSGYIAALIRADRERCPPTVYPANRVELNETKPKP